MNVEAVEVRWEDVPRGAGETLDEPGNGDEPGDASQDERLGRLGGRRLVASADTCASLNPTTSAMWYVDGATGEAAKVPPSAPARGLAFVARRAVAAGEEVFFDYRLDPGDAELPEWYRPTAPEEPWRVVDEAEFGRWRGVGEGDWGRGAPRRARG